MEELESAILAFLESRLGDGRATCALDVANDDAITLEEVGELLGLTRERIRQIELIGLQRLRAGAVVKRLFRDLTGKTKK